MTLDELVKEFGDCVAAQGEALKRGDASAGNRFARRYVMAFEKLRARGDQGREALANLLDDDRASVRVMAAAYLLRYCENRAKAILEAEAGGTGILAFGAAQALQRWKEGTWNLDPT